MADPFRSEAQAFRFVLLVAVAAAAIVAAHELAGATVLAVVSGLAVAAVASAYLLRRAPARSLPAAPAHLGPAEERRALLLVEEAPDEASLAGLRERADRVLVVAPALTSTLHLWVSDVDGAREQAQQRVEEAVARAREARLDASGVVGDEDPLAAVDDALRTFGGDELFVSTGDHELIRALRRRYALPVTAGRSGA